MDFNRLAEACLARCQKIAGFSEVGNSITRTFLSDPMHECHAAISAWMRELGMQVRVDAIGNIRGLLGNGQRPRLLLGSHLDTVPCAGAYDGVLGVCIALEMLEAFRGSALPFDVEVLGFSEEEGVRFRTPFLGSLATVGLLDQKTLRMQDAAGCSVWEAIKQFGLDPTGMEEARIDDRAFGYLEFHIEQGPVLDKAGESIAVVESIAGQSRLDVVFSGRANHAGTTPMGLRHDALMGAAEWMTALEQYACSVEGLVATIGSVRVTPGAGNVIPGEVRTSLDVRHWSDETRVAGVQEIVSEGARTARKRGLGFEYEERLNQNAVMLDPQLVAIAEQATKRIGEVPRRMVSGAGHDAMIMARKVPSMMIFVRSIAGISHHPDEAVHKQDVEKAIRVGVSMLADPMLREVAELRMMAK